MTFLDFHEHTSPGAQRRFNRLKSMFRAEFEVVAMGTKAGFDEGSFGVGFGFVFSSFC
jgi:hypothetical protein